MDSEKLRKSVKVGVLLAIAATTFYIIAFTSNGWYVHKLGNEMIKAGIWYVTLCDGHGECKTISKKEQFDAYKNSFVVDTTYMIIIRWQFFSTITLVCLCVCTLMVIIALYRRTFNRRIRLVVIVCSVLSGFLLLQDIGMSLRESIISMQQSEEYAEKSIVYFPWSILMGFLAVVFIFAVVCICFRVEWKLLRDRNQQLQQLPGQGNTQLNQSRTSTVFWTLLIAISIMFRIIAYASNGWRVVNFGFGTSRYGLWYLTVCSEYSHPHCDTMSVKESFENDPHKDITGYAYSEQVRSQVALTLSLVLSIICLILFFTELRRHQSNNLIRFNIILSSLLSGTFWLYDVGYYIRLYAYDLNNQSSRNYITYFPWSILFALLGGILIVLFSFVRFVKELRSKETDYGPFIDTQGIDLSSSIPGSNTRFNGKM